MRTDHLDVVVRPDVWTVLTAIGTVGAVIVALLAAWYSVRAGRTERAQMEDDSARNEARKVVVVPDQVFTTDSIQTTTSREVIRIINGGADPILDAELIYGGLDQTLDEETTQWSIGIGFQAHYTPVVLSGQEYEYTGQWRDATTHDAPIPNASRGQLYGVIAWSDARDRHWLRKGRERPVELWEPYKYGDLTTPRHRADRRRPVIQRVNDDYVQRTDEQRQAQASARLNAARQDHPWILRLTKVLAPLHIIRRRPELRDAERRNRARQDATDD